MTATEEAARLEILTRYALLDSPPEPEFDQLTVMAAKLFNVPIAMVSLVDSADATTKSRERLLALGANDYLPKPYNIATLLIRLDTLLRNSDG